MNSYNMHWFWLLVATQKDRRDEMKPGEGAKCCSTAEGQKVADDLELVAFIETSALKDQEVLDHNLYNTAGSKTKTRNAIIKQSKRFMLFSRFIGTERSFWGGLQMGNESRSKEERKKSLSHSLISILILQYLG